MNYLSLQICAVRSLLMGLPLRCRSTLQRAIPATPDLSGCRDTTPVLVGGGAGGCDVPAREEIVGKPYPVTAAR